MTKRFGFTLAEGATHIGNCDSYHKYAFTLAEVLITLGIIGVVAAMTIPTLITNYNDKVLETQKLKTKSILANAFKMMMANEGVTDLSLAPIASCGDDKNCYATEFGKVMKVLSEVDSTSDNAKIDYGFTNGNDQVWSKDKLYTFVMNDGTVISVEKTNGVTSGNITLAVDLNGFKGPNIGAKDLCKYVVSNNAIVGEQCSAMASHPEDATGGGDGVTTCDAGFFMSEDGECLVNDVPNCEIQTQPNSCTKCMEGFISWHEESGWKCYPKSGGSDN